jgi:hypothetical protein
MSAKIIVATMRKRSKLIQPRLAVKGHIVFFTGFDLIKTIYLFEKILKRKLYSISEATSTGEYILFSTAVLFTFRAVFI